MFRKKYVLRRYGEQGEDADNASFSYTDTVIELNVQPLSARELEALPEGARGLARVRGFGSFPVRTVDQRAGTPPDRIWYHGQWFECEQADNWEHTPLAHYESQWAAVAEGDTEPPPERGIL